MSADAIRRSQFDMMSYPRPNVELFETALSTMKEESRL